MTTVVSIEGIHYVLPAELSEEIDIQDMSHSSVHTIVFLRPAYMRIRGSIGRHNNSECTGIFHRR